MKIAIFKESDKTLHSGNWTTPWEEFLTKKKIDFDLVDLWKTDSIEKLRDYDILLWHFGQYNYQEMLEARSILYAARSMGLKVFPDFSDCWHFDDKVAEMYALQAVKAPIPKSHVYYDIHTLREAIDNGTIQFPIVGKLRTGSGSHNVKLLKSKSQLLRYGKRMLSNGYNPAPSLFYKTSSNIRASHNKTDFIAKLKRAPEFLRTLKGARAFPHEKGYVYLQEFIPNNGFDMKVVVVGNKLSGLYRPIRSHDFRASGGGEVKYDKKLFTPEVIKSAFETADALHTNCIGFDYVIDNHTGKPYIVEMSYGFSHTAVMGMGGYFDRNGQWHDGALNAPEEIVKNLMKIQQKHSL